MILLEEPPQERGGEGERYVGDDVVGIRTEVKGQHVRLDYFGSSGEPSPQAVDATRVEFERGYGRSVGDERFGEHPVPSAELENPIGRRVSKDLRHLSGETTVDQPILAEFMWTADLCCGGEVVTSLRTAVLRHISPGVSGSRRPQDQRGRA